VYNYNRRHETVYDNKAAGFGQQPRPLQNRYIRADARFLLEIAGVHSRYRFIAVSLLKLINRRASATGIKLPASVTRGHKEETDGGQDSGCYRTRAAAEAAAVTQSGGRLRRRPLQKEGGRYRRPLQEAGGRHRRPLKGAGGRYRRPLQGAGGRYRRPLPEQCPEAGCLNTIIGIHVDILSACY
jgi:hypothetical protein